jgi:hypothetical protein
MQASKSTWNGMMLWGPLVDTLKRGDSVSVTGVIFEYSNRTQMQVTSMPFFLRDGATAITPVVQSMTASPYFDYDLSNPSTAGTSKFESYESMLVELQNVYLFYRNADNLANTNTGNYGEFFVSPDTKGPYGFRVNDNGVNHYYADTNANYKTVYAATGTHLGLAGNKTQLIPYMSKISYIRGILDYTNSNYKLEPRKDDDFGSITTSVFIEPNVIPKGFELNQNFPNPFNPSTTIRYAITAQSNVTLRIFNILGQEVESLVNMQQGAGSYVVQFNASRLSTGVYFYELRAGDYRDIKKMVLLK